MNIAVTVMRVKFDLHHNGMIWKYFLRVLSDGIRIQIAIIYSLLCAFMSIYSS